MAWHSGNTARPKTKSVVDRKLVITIIGLLIFGLIMLFSASSVVGYVKGGSSLYFVKHQLLGLIIGLPLLIILAKVDYHRFKPVALYALVACFFLLILVFVPGLSASYGKASNWINIFGFSFQPSEFVKILFLIMINCWTLPFVSATVALIFSNNT